MVDYYSQQGVTAQVVADPAMHCLLQNMYHNSIWSLKSPIKLENSRGKSPTFPSTRQPGCFVCQATLKTKSQAPWNRTEDTYPRHCSHKFSPKHKISFRALTKKNMRTLSKKTNVKSSNSILVTRIQTKQEEVSQHNCKIQAGAPSKEPLISFTTFLLLKKKTQENSCLKEELFIAKCSCWLFKKTKPP